MRIVCGFLMMCSVLLWMVDVWLDCSLVSEKGFQGPVECSGSSQPRCPPESCPGWPYLGHCQAPSPTCSARWVGPFGGRSGLPDTSPHSDSGAGPWGFLGPGQVNHHGRSWRGARAVLQWAVLRVCVCLCVCLGLVSSQGPLPSTFIYTACFSLTATRPGGFSPPPRPWSLHIKAACC